MTLVARHIARLCLVLSLFGALAASGFAHRAMGQEMDVDLLAYVQAGGSLADICGDGAEHGMGGKCDACRLVDNVAAPDTAAQPGRESAPVAVANWTVAEVLRGFVGDPSRPARAPPLV